MKDSKHVSTETMMTTEPTYRAVPLGQALDLPQFTFTKPQRQKLQAIADRCDELEGLKPEPEDFKRIQAEALQDLIDGKTSLATAGLMLAIDNADKRKAFISSCRRAIQRACNDLANEARPILVEAAEFAAEQLKAKCRELEQAERTTLEDIGINQDLYTPSSALLRLRASYDEARAKVKTLSDGSVRVSPAMVTTALSSSS